ncbi:MAG: hypothetical protein IKA81_03010, partial [Alistipes sp.]|nr:hypothetical protein [Alistipes sp.]
MKNENFCDSGASVAPQSLARMECTPSTIHPSQLLHRRNICTALTKNWSRALDGYGFPTWEGFFDFETKENLENLRSLGKST